MNTTMTEQSALSQSTEWINGSDRLYGYLPFQAANFLVGTGKYEWAQSTCWGYIVRLKPSVSSLAPPQSKSPQQ